MKQFILGVFGLCLVGCIHAPTGGMAVAPGTPAPSPTAVAACQKERTWHNIWTVSASLFGGLAGAQGTVDAVVTDKTAQTGIGIGAAATGVLAAISATAAGIEADSYATDNCQVILMQAASAAAP